MPKIRGLGHALDRYTKGCVFLERAVAAWQAGDLSKYEKDIRSATTEGIGAIELVLKIYLKHICRTKMTDDEQAIVDGRANFNDLVDLMKKHAEPTLDDRTARDLFDYRDMRNWAEHHGSLTASRELQDALQTIGQLILIYLPLEEKQRSNVEPFLAKMENLLPEPGTESGVEHIAYQPTRTQEGSQTLTAIQEMLEEISSYLRDVHLSRLTQHGDQIIAESRRPSAMLRERQIPYLERHTLFAGREAEMEQIRSFLHNRQQGYIFVTGPSGYGKTALLANLISSQPDRYVWHFLSQLEGEHTRHRFLRSMVEQLLAYYQMPVRSEADLPETDDRLEALYVRLMRMPLVRAGHPLVLVIDGMDEAEDTFIKDLHIPRVLSDGKFIIFSARQTGRDYVREFGLLSDDTLTITLDRLDRAGIQSVLRTAGGQASDWADDPALLHEVERISEGDPFYLRYLVEDIAAGTITPDQVEQQPAGLRPYLDGWWKQVVKAVRRDQDLRNLMGILMVARGPLPRNDLFRPYPELEWGFDNVLDPVCRFVTVSQVDGHAVYALCHPRFRDYLAQYKLRNQVATYQRQMLDFCAGWQEHRSHYALRHYAGHLSDAQQRDTLFALARNEVFSAAQRSQLPDEPDLPLRAVQAALLEAAEIDDAATMAEFVLRHARRLAEITAQKSPLDALRVGSLRRAWELADLHDLERRTLWYLLLAWELSDTNQPHEVDATLARLQEKPLHLSDWQGQQAAYLLAQMFELNPETLSAALPSRLLDGTGRSTLCKHLTAHGLFAAALETAQSMEDGDKRVEALRNVAVAQAQVGEFTTALEIAQGIEDEDKREETLQGIAIAQAEAGEFDAALDTAMMTEIDGDWCSVILGDIAIARAQAGKFDDALETVQMGIMWLNQEIEALRGIVLAQAKAGEFDAALATAEKLAAKDAWEHMMAVRDIALVQAQLGEFATALKTVQKIERSAKGPGILWSISKLHVGEHVLTGDDVLKDLIPCEQTQALRGIAVAQAQAGEREAARATFDAALQTVQKVEIEQFRSEILGDIAAAQAQVGRFGDALETAQEIETEQMRPRVLRDIAVAQAQAGRFDDALEIAQGIETEQMRPQALRDISVAQAQAGKLDDALETAQGIEAEQPRMEVLRDVAIAQAQAGEFGDALKIAQKIEDEQMQVEALEGIISQAQAGEFDAALEIAQKIEGASERAKVLGDVAIAQAQTGERDAARSTLAVALETAQTTEWEQCQAETLRDIETVQAETEEFAPATETDKNRAQRVITSDTWFWLLEEMQKRGDERSRSRVLCDLAEFQAIAGLGEQALRTTDQILTEHNEHLPAVAGALAKAGETASFKRLLLPCAYYPDAAHRMCGLLAQVYPDQAESVSQIVRQFQWKLLLRSQLSDKVPM